MNNLSRHLLIQDYEKAHAELPDNYLIYHLSVQSGKIVGSNPYLEGFSIAIESPIDELLTCKYLNEYLLHNLIRDQKLIGELEYPNGKTTQIVFQVVNHRGKDDVYMKTTLGYFLWEEVSFRENGISFLINFFYTPPAEKADLEILEMAQGLLLDPQNWHNKDSRKCEGDIARNIWSLFCALKHASMSIRGEFNPHGAAIQAIRKVIMERVEDHEYEHPIMDFNNAEEVEHDDILAVIQKAKENLSAEVAIHPAG